MLQNITTDRNRESERAQRFMARQAIGTQLASFDGNPKDWLSFSSEFRRTTEQCGYTDSENVSRLRKCLKGKAFDAVRMVIQNSANVEAANEILEVNFGRPESTIRSLIEESRKIPTVNGWDYFVAFSNGVLNLAATIENLDEHFYAANPLLLRGRSSSCSKTLGAQTCIISAPG
jgi:Protein of unknown function (DUF1759)